MSIGWYHQTNESEQWDGFNDSGLHHFTSDPLKNMAREIIQNAYDAGDGSGKVSVCFKLKEVETSTIPNFDELISNINRCQVSAKKSNDEKASPFFKNALEVLAKKTIKVLEASDYNTQGMKGPSKNGTPFYAFVKAKGQSQKDGETASGSYGIGKFAPYVVSDIHTVFVSTIYEVDGACKQLSQGKSVLMSHYDNEDTKGGIGFWGIKARCQPIEGCSGLPGWILRSTNEDELCNLKGSKISILCFNDEPHWEEYLAATVAENFFAAISEDNLSVEINDKYSLNSETIFEFFVNPELRKIIVDSKLNGEPEKFENAFNYYSVLQESPEVIVENKQHTHLGLCKLRIIVGEDLPKKLCALRNGMFISDSINRLKQFSDFKEFVAVFQCESAQGNKLLRQMEPPRHDDFEPNLLPKEEREKGRRSLSAIATWIREMLKKHAKDPVEEVTSLDELKDFFGDEGGEGSGDDKQEMNPLGKLYFRAKPSKQNSGIPKPSSKIGDGDTGDGEDGDGGGGDKGKGGGNGKGGKGVSPGGSGGGGEQKKTVEITNVRAIISGANKRKIFLTPTKSGEMSISIQEAGADSDYETEIVSADIGVLKNGAVVINCKAGERVTLNVDLVEDFTGAVKVVANEI